MLVAFCEATDRTITCDTLAYKYFTLETAASVATLISKYKDSRRRARSDSRGPVTRLEAARTEYCGWLSIRVLLEIGMGGTGAKSVTVATSTIQV